MKNPETVKKVEKTLQKMGHRIGKKNGRFRHDVYDDSYLTFLYWDLLLPTSYIMDFFKISNIAILNRLRKNRTCLKNKSIQNTKGIWLFNRFVKIKPIFKSKYKNIHYDKSSRGIKNWRVRKTINNKKYNIGHFYTQEEAYKALIEFNKKMGLNTHS